MYPPEPYKARKKRHSGPSLPRPAFAGFGRGRRARLGRKDVALTLLGVLVVYLVYRSWGAGSFGQELESVRLQRLMNDGAPARGAWDVKSSFDWGAIKFKFPPPSDPAPLPGTGTGTGTRGRGSSGLPPVQHRFPRETAAARAVREARRDEVRAVFLKSWRSYRRFAWMQDALLPVSGGGRDQFSGWSATLVDALDTLWIMGLRDEFDEAVDAVARSRFP
jgi:mannosyl-oligosaccharide alpha-1,2-mannosidase